MYLGGDKWKHNTSGKTVGGPAKEWNWEPPEYTPEVLLLQLTYSVRVPLMKLIVAYLFTGYGHYTVPIKRIEFTSFNFNIILSFMPTSYK
jgi:hypothetical protein